MSQKLHFHSIDALRFFAFLKVYFLHIPIQASFPIFAYLKAGGGLGVAFFFVLSGFLISYLLVFDKLQNGTIHVKNFFIRRSLRIWPLFYLIVILVFLLPFSIKDNFGWHIIQHGYALDWRYSFSFLENYKMLMTDNYPKTTPLSVFWSLCIEEHFYIFWLICLFYLPIKHMPKFFVGCFFLAWSARLAEPLIFQNTNIVSNDLFTNLDFFASGAFLGFFVAKDDKATTNFINSIPIYIKYCIVILVISIVIFRILPYYENSWFNVFRPSIIAISFAAFLALFIPQNSRIKIKNHYLNYLGSISYGLYVYHIIFIHITLHFCVKNAIKIDDWPTLLLFISFTFCCTVICSMLSYHLFEKKFLLLREHLTRK